MARNLRIFNTYNDYEAAELVRPAVSLVLSPRKVYYDPLSPTPPTPTFDGKWKATYSDSHTESAECDSSSAITKYEISSGNLISVEIGDCVTSIGLYAFRNCRGLTSCTIGSGVTSIGDYAFEACSGLTSVTIPNSVTSIGDGAFNYCTSLTSITIPSGVTSIGESTFQACSGLTSIDIPSGVTNIGIIAFQHCKGLAEVTCNAITPPTLGDDAFYNTNNCPIYVPADSVSAYQSAWSRYSSRIQPIPNS